MPPGKIEPKAGPIVYLCVLVVVYLVLVYKGWVQGRDKGKEVLEWELNSLWQEDQKYHKNPHNFNYLINPKDSVCGKADVTMLILVTSSISHSDRRLAIRETWGSQQMLDRSQVKILFLLGNTATPDEALEEDIETENENYNDILREDFLDSYQNLTLKTLGGVKWGAIFCSQAQFVLKTDDDMYVNVPLLTSYLATEYSGVDKVITGCVKNGPGGAPQPLSPHGDGLPFKTVHPLFTAGAGYVLSGDLMEPLYRASLDIRLIRVEDAFLTGYCARAVGDIRKYHNQHFSCGEMVQSDCSLTSQFTGHKVTPDRMKIVHRKIVQEQCGN